VFNVNSAVLGSSVVPQNDNIHVNAKKKTQKQQQQQIELVINLYIDNKFPSPKQKEKR